MSGFLDRLAGMTTQSLLIMAILVSGFYYMAVFDDGSSLDVMTTRLRGELAEQEKTVKESDLALAEIEQVRASFGALSEQFQMVSAQLPTSIEQTEILGLVDRISRESGLTVKSKEWRELRKEGAVLEVLPMRILAEGSFPEIYTFIAKMSEIERVITMGNLSIKAPRNTKQTTRSQLELEVKVYRFVGANAAKGAGK